MHYKDAESRINQMLHIFSEILSNLRLQNEQQNGNSENYENYEHYDSETLYARFLAFTAEIQEVSIQVLGEGVYDFDNEIFEDGGYDQDYIDQMENFEDFDESDWHEYKKINKLSFNSKEKDDMFNISKFKDQSKNNPKTKILENKQLSKKKRNRKRSKKNDSGEKEKAKEVKA